MDVVSLLLLLRKKTVCRVEEKLITGLPIPAMNKHARNSFLYLMQIYRPDVAAFSSIRMKNCTLGHQVARETGNVRLGKQWNIMNYISASRIMKVHGSNAGGCDFVSPSSETPKLLE